MSSWYRTGTVSVQNGSRIVIGTGTAWNAGAKVSEGLKAPDGQLYEIESINSDQQITLATAYLGGTAAGQTYVIVPTQSYLRDLAKDVEELINEFGGVVDGVGAGKFPPGAANSASVRGIADEDTGVNFPGNNILQLVTGGAARVTVAADGGTTFAGGVTAPRVVTGYGSSVNDAALLFGSNLYSMWVNPGGDSLRVQVGGTANFVLDSGGGFNAPGAVNAGTAMNAGRFVLRDSPGTCYVAPGPADGASASNFNMALGSWNGVGITPTLAGSPIPVGTASHVFDARTGNSLFRGALSNIGNAAFGPSGYAGFPYSFNIGGNTDNNSMLALGDNRGQMIYFRSQVGPQGSYSNSTMVLNCNVVNNRSINAGGTVNASGSDYAEYHQKSADILAEGGDVIRGQIIGLNEGDEITDRWSLSSSFAVKSTNPSFVGGDLWARPVGEPPLEPAFIEPEPLPYDLTEEEGKTLAQIDAMRSEYVAAMATAKAAARAAFDAGPMADYLQKKQVFNAAVEVERQKVDRIAYSGRVPVNVQGAKPGDYIVAEEGPNDTIVGQVVSASAMRADMSQYLRVVGRVRSIEAGTGRAVVAVVIH